MTAGRYFTGTLDGRELKLDRMFRGKMLDDRECAALFRGREIEVHGLKRGRTEYSVLCRLEPDAVLDGVANVRSLGTVGMNRDYRLDRETSPFRPHGLRESVPEGDSIDGDLLDRETQAMVMGDEAVEYVPGRGMYATGPSVPSGPGRERLELAERIAGSWRSAIGI